VQAGPGPPSPAFSSKAVMDKNEKLTDFLLLENNWAGIEKILDAVGEGLLLELGVYHGDSFNKLCGRFYPRIVYGFDWFYGTVEDWKSRGDIGSFTRDGIPPECPVNGRFVVGKVEDTIRRFTHTFPEPAALVHFDLDTYSPTLFALHNLNFRKGTILLFDEIDGYVCNQNHEQRAVREWLKETYFDIEFVGRQHQEAIAIRLI
jgi:hypothetical protein